MKINREILAMSVFLVGLPIFCRADAPGPVPDNSVGDELKVSLPEVLSAQVKKALSGFIFLGVDDSGRLGLNRKAWDTMKAGEKRRAKRYQEILAEIREREPYSKDNELKEKARGILDFEMPLGPAERAVFYRFRREGSLNYSGGGSGDGSHEYFANNGLFCSMDLRDKKEILFLFSNAQPTLAPLYLSVLDNGYGRFSLSMIIGESGPFLTIAQKHDGRISLQFLNKEDHASLQAGTFSELLAANKELLQKKVFPVLAHVGVRLPPFLDPILKEGVIKLLSFDKDKGLLDKAILEYRENYDDVASLGQYASAIDDLKVSELRLITVLGLVDDPGFLSNLLGQVNVEQEKELIALRLEKLTGQHLGKDAAAWAAWWKANSYEWREKMNPAPQVPVKSPAEEEFQD